MKNQFTFNEVGKIFKVVYEIEERGNAYKAAREEYETIGAKFDARFAELNYSFRNSTKEDRALFEIKCDAMDNMDKKEKAFNRAVKKFSYMVGIGENYDDIVAEELKGYCRNVSYYKIERIIRDVKYMAKRAAERIEY